MHILDKIKETKDTVTFSEGEVLSESITSIIAQMGNVKMLLEKDDPFALVLENWRNDLVRIRRVVENKMQ